MLEGVLGAKVGLMGTNQNLIGDRVLPAHRTTPESWEVQQLLRQMADAGCTHVVMEASSHALVLHRLDGIPFAAGVFTNLTRDHLDFHKTMEAYRDAKGLLFRQCAGAALNLDDEAGRYYADTAPCPVFTYSERHDEAGLTAKNLRLFPDRVEFEAVARGAISRVRLPIPGGFSVYNALAAAAVGRIYGMTTEEIKKGIESLEAISGRFKMIETDSLLIVDDCYNANPMSMKASLDVLHDGAGRRVAILGDMGELGENEIALHREVGAHAATCGIDACVCVGSLARHMAEAAREADPEFPVFYEGTRESLLENLGRYIEEGDTVLVKASHFMKFEEVVKALQTGID